MEIISLNYTDLRLKTAEKIKSYLALSENNRLTIGLYCKGNVYVFGDPAEENRLRYDIGSVSKTVTAHYILKLAGEGKLDLNHRVDRYLPLKKGKYPTIYQLLTHTAGYHHLTPVEVTLPALVRSRYARKNPYESCTVKTVIKALERRRFWTPRVRYGYSDFSAAILAAVAESVMNKPFSPEFEAFFQKELGLADTVLQEDPESRKPLAAEGKKILPFWVWREENPYLAAGGMVSGIADVLRYIALQIESDKPYITEAHRICKESKRKKDNHLMCIGWHTYEKSNQLWHVGGVGTFRSSIILNKKQKLGVAVLGNAKGKASANAHYIAKMLYSELKNKRIRLKGESKMHEMKLHPAPFAMIKQGDKTIELRLYDEKRRRIRAGDQIVFTNTATGETLDTTVVKLHRFDSFEELYNALPLFKCGYIPEDIETAHPSDMKQYYSAEEQEKYGVVGIEIQVIK